MGSTLKNARPCSVAVILIAMILITMSAVVQAAPLTVVEVGAPAINCVYNTTCQIVVNDTIGSIPVPGVSGTARLQSREFGCALGAFIQMRLAQERVGCIELTIEQAVQQQFFVSTRAHRICSSRSALSICRARANRDITVPTGTLVTSAICL